MVDIIVSAFRKFTLIQHPNGCATWPGFRDWYGYGRVSVKLVRGRSSSVLAHRAAWAAEHGTMPPSGLCVCHRCDNPPCCNPDHLFLGTAKDNFDDCRRKGRFRANKINESMVRDISAQVGRSARSVAREYGVSPYTVCAIWKGQTWKHLGLPIRTNLPRRGFRVGNHCDGV